MKIFLNLFISIHFEYPKIHIHFLGEEGGVIMLPFTRNYYTLKDHFKCVFLRLEYLHQVQSLYKKMEVFLMIKKTPCRLGEKIIQFTSVIK